MASIRKRGNKYHVQIRRNGFASRTRSFLKLSDAKEWARLVEGQADRNELAPCQKVLKTTLLADLVARYRDEVVPSKKGVEVETIILNRFLRHPICRKRSSEITTADFALYRDERLKDITAKSLKRQLSPIQNMFSHAIVEWEIPIRENPLARLKLKFVDNKRERRLQAGEFERLEKALERIRNRYVPLIISFALATAMRRGEILSLRWRDVDEWRATVSIRETKTGFARTIPLSQTAQAIIERARETPSNISPNSLVFPITAMALKMCWRRVILNAGLADFHFHDLRHEAISRLFEMGLTVPEVASVSGHRTLAQLMRYSHANQQSIREKLVKNRTKDDGVVLEMTE